MKNTSFCCGSNTSSSAKPHPKDDDKHAHQVLAIENALGLLASLLKFYSLLLSHTPTFILIFNRVMRE